MWWNSPHEEIPHIVSGTGKFRLKIVFGSPRHGLCLRMETLDEVLRLPIRKTLHETLAHFPLQLREVKFPPMLFFFRDGRSHFFGRSSGTRGERENVDLRESDMPDDLARFEKFLLGLSRETHDDVGRECRLVEDLFGGFAPFNVLFDRSRPIHPAVDRWGAALHGKVKVRADPFPVGRHDLKEIVSRFVCFQTGEAQTKIVSSRPIRIHFRQPFHQLRQIRFPRTFPVFLKPPALHSASGIQTIVSEMDPGEDDLAVSAAQERVDF